MYKPYHMQLFRLLRRIILRNLRRSLIQRRIIPRTRGHTRVVRQPRIYTDLPFQQPGNRAVLSDPKQPFLLLIGTGWPKESVLKMEVLKGSVCWSIFTEQCMSVISHPFLLMYMRRVVNVQPTKPERTVVNGSGPISSPPLNEGSSRTS